LRPLLFQPASTMHLGLIVERRPLTVARAHCCRRSLSVRLGSLRGSRATLLGLSKGRERDRAQWAVTLALLAHCFHFGAPFRCRPAKTGPTLGGSTGALHAGRLAADSPPSCHSPGRPSMPLVIRHLRGAGPARRRLVSKMLICTPAPLRAPPHTPHSPGSARARRSSTLALKDSLARAARRPARGPAHSRGRPAPSRWPLFQHVYCHYQS